MDSENIYCFLCFKTRWPLKTVFPYHSYLSFYSNRSLALENCSLTSSSPYFSFLSFLLPYNTYPTAIFLFLPDQGCVDPVFFISGQVHVGSELSQKSSVRVRVLLLKKTKMSNQKTRPLSGSGNLMSGRLRSGPGPGLARYFFGPGPDTRTALFQITVPILSAHSLFYLYHVRWPLYSLKNSVWTIFTLSRRRWIPCSAHFLSIEPCFFPVYPRRLYSSRSSPDILVL